MIQHLQSRYAMLTEVFRHRFPEQPIPQPTSDHPQAIINANQQIVAALTGREPIAVRTGSPVEVPHIDERPLPTAPPPRRAHT